MKTHGRNSFSSILPALILLFCSACQSQQLISLSGAGASFPFPVYSQWMYRYNIETGVQLDYQSIGSGGGIERINARQIDFCGSDIPFQKKELEEMGLIQFPMIMGGIVPVIHVDGIAPGQMKLTSDLLSDIFLGRVTRWNHPRLQAINPGMALPDLKIRVVHRADESGSTWTFTNYLNKTSPEWHAKVGTGKLVDWPVGFGGKGNEGVAVFVQRIEGAVGYVEFAYALQNKLTHVQLKNRSGCFVNPTMETFQAAARGVDWKQSSDFYTILTHQPGKNSWPITTVSFILMHKNQTRPRQTEAMLNFFKWCYHQGESIALKLHYVPIPPDVVTLIEKSWLNQITVNNRPIAWE